MFQIKSQPINLELLGCLKYHKNALICEILIEAIH